MSWYLSLSSLTANQWKQKSRSFLTPHILALVLVAQACSKSFKLYLGLGFGGKGKFGDEGRSLGCVGHCDAWIARRKVFCLMEDLPGDPFQFATSCLLSLGMLIVQGSCRKFAIS